MKTITFFSLLLSAAVATAQVDIDKPINLSGADGDRKITNLELPVDGTDAANKDYVDSSASASGGGGSAKPEAMSDEGPSTMTFKDAVQYCENLDEDSHTDWRMPTLQEALYFTGSEANANFFWTLSETPGLDYAVNQNIISVRLSDGKWRNGGSETFFFPPRSVSASSLTGTSWSTVDTYLPIYTDGTFVPTSLVLSISNGCGSPGNTQYFRVNYNYASGTTTTSQVFQAGNCSSGSNVINSPTIPVFPGSSPLSSITVEHYKDSGALNGSFSLSIAGYETMYSQKDGNPLHVRCVR